MQTLLRRHHILPGYSVNEIGYRARSYAEHASQSTLTVSLSEHVFDVCCVLSGQFRYATPSGVFSLSDWLQMVRIYTQTSFAQMIESISIWYRAVLLLIVISVRSIANTINSHQFWIAFGSLGTLPYPATGNGINDKTLVTQSPSVWMMTGKVSKRVSCFGSSCSLVSFGNRNRITAATQTVTRRVGWFYRIKNCLLSAFQFLINRLRIYLDKASIFTKSSSLQLSDANQVKHIGIRDIENRCNLSRSHGLFNPFKIRWFHYSTTAHCAQLYNEYNAGAGLPYASFTV